MWRYLSVYARNVVRRALGSWLIIGPMQMQSDGRLTLHIKPRLWHPLFWVHLAWHIFKTRKERL